MSQEKKKIEIEVPKVEPVKIANKIKYRTDHCFERVGSVFSDCEYEYQLDEEQKKPVVVGIVNIQERIQSSEDCALNKILDKYLDVLPNVKVETDEATEYTRHNPDLADLGAEYERVYALKEAYNLDPKLSYADTLVELKKMKSNIDNVILKAQEQALKNKEVSNEKTQIEQKSE